MSEPSIQPGMQPNMQLGPLARRPAVLTALWFIFGILLHDRLPLQSIGLLVAIAIVALSTFLCLHRRLLSSALLCLLCLLLGAGLAQREHFHFDRDDIGQFASDDPHLTEIQGRLLDDPQISVGPPGTQRLLPPKQMGSLDVEMVRTWNGWTTATGRVPVQIDQINPSLRAGQTVRMLGMLQRPRAAMNPGEFDWAQYYRQQRILANLTVTRAGNIHILTEHGPGIIGWLRGKCRDLLSQGFTAARAPEAALLDALVLGNHNPELRDIQDQFKQTGLAYQLSVSGLHIALLAGGVYWLCRRLRLHPRRTLLITTAFTLLYGMIALPSHSGIRSVIICLVVTTALLAGRSTDRLQLTAIAIIAMLLWHPLDLYSAGFQLSFVVAVTFLFLIPRLKQSLKAWEDPDEKAKPLRPAKPAWVKFFETIGQWLMYALIAWLATLPLAMYHFGFITGWSIILSIAVFPVVIVALFCGALKIPLSLLWPRLDHAWAIFAGTPAHFLLSCVHQSGRLPGSSIPLPTPPLWAIVVYYTLLFTPLLPHRWILVGRPRRLLPVAPLSGVLLLFCVAFTSPKAVSHDELRVTLLSLGAGQCAVVEPPGGAPVLIDAGSSTVTDVAIKLVEPFLRAQRESRVDSIFLSHGDFDHISAAGEITTDYNVRTVFTSFHFIRNSAGNIPDQLLLDELEKLDRPPHQIKTGDSIDIGHGVKITVLWPPPVGDLNSNNAGLVLRLTYAGRSILFPADIQDPGFAGTLQQPAALKSDVLVAPHHGSSENLTPAFLAAVHPQLILSSNFWRLTNKQKRFETMVGSTPLYRTPQCGAITIIISKDGSLSVHTFRGVSLPPTHRNY